MKVRLKNGLIVLVSQSEDEARELAAWQGVHEGHVFHARADAAGGGRSLVLSDLGERMEACREPINVVSTSSDPHARTIGNFADTPFDLDGRAYRSVESFWQGLKFAADADRRRLASMSGAKARAEGERQGYGDVVTYEGREIAVGTWAHWQLMEAACVAKFAQCAEARAALLATGNRPLAHIVRRDSRTIPGVVMAEIWMRIRRRLQK